MAFDWLRLCYRPIRSQVWKWNCLVHPSQSIKWPPSFSMQPILSNACPWKKKCVHSGEILKCVSWDPLDHTVVSIYVSNGLVPLIETMLTRFTYACNYHGVLMFTLSRSRRHMNPSRYLRKHGIKCRQLSLNIFLTQLVHLYINGAAVLNSIMEFLRIYKMCPSFVDLSRRWTHWPATFSRHNISYTSQYSAIFAGQIFRDVSEMCV